MSLSRTMSRLGRLRKAMVSPAEQAAVPDRLSDLPSLADNPGQLRGRYFVPANLSSPAALVVVLHGCTQDAASYDHGSGWSRLADRQGFALLFPEQRRSNNLNLCFNWYQPDDVGGGRGEAASIRAMIAQMMDMHAIDPALVFVTGLSAGGAMASALLAAYPETFAGGAIISGLPVSSGDNLAEALSAMSSPAPKSSKALGDAVRRASTHKGPWPRISIWHGGSDRLVMPVNADASVRQWCDVHGLAAEPDRIERVDGHPRRIWLGEDGDVLVDEYIIAGMAHGTPLKPGRAVGQSGVAGAHMLDVGLSSTDQIAAFFGLAKLSGTGVAERPLVQEAAAAAKSRQPNLTRISPPANDVQAVIESALRAAGLLR